MISENDVEDSSAFAARSPSLTCRVSMTGESYQSNIKNRKSSSGYRPTIVLWVLIVGGIAAELTTKFNFGDLVSFFSPWSRSWELALGGVASIGIKRSIDSATQNFGMSRLVGGFGYVLIGVSFFYLGSDLSSNPFLRFVPCLGALLALRFPFSSGRRI